MQVKVKHLIEYLQKFDPELEVVLDHDGWMESDFPSKDEVELIKNRQLFWKELPENGEEYLLVSN